MTSMVSSMRFCVCWALCLLLLFAAAGVYGGCEEQSHGQCNANNSRYIGDREVLTPESLSCTFAGSLCQYRQGCRDETMTPWTANSGYASVRQNKTGCGAAVYSVLESRWVLFNKPVCLHFSFSSKRPQYLEVFFAPFNGSAATKLLGEKDNKFPEGEEQSEKCSIGRSTGKILFRIYGGAPGPEGGSLKLFPVSFQVGLCQPDCSFNEEVDRLCGWTAVNWAATNRGATVNTTNGVATLTSPLTRATGENHVDCLTFKFRVKQTLDSLDVVVDVSDMSVTVLRLRTRENKWNEAQVQIVTVEPYKIVLSGHKSDGSGGVSVKKVKVTALGSNQECETLPPSAAVNVTLPLGVSVTEPANDGALIGGVVAAVLIVVIVVIVVAGIFFYKRKSRNDSSDKELPAFRSETTEGRCEANNEYDVCQPPESDYTYIDNLPLAADPGDDASPYAVLEDSSPRNSHIAGTSGFGTQDPQKAPARAHLHKKAESDYTHTGSKSTQLSKPEASGPSDDYNHISTFNHPTPAGSRTPRHGQETAKTTALPHPDYELAKVRSSNQTGPQAAKVSPGYSLVRNTEQTSRGASASLQEKEEHDTAVAGGLRTRDRNADPGKFQVTSGLTAGAVLQKRSGHVKESAENKQFTYATSKEENTCQYSLQKPVQDVPDDYNTLNFDEGGNELAKNDNHGAACKPYHTVRCVSDDEYSRTQSEQQTTVIDFNYDHLK
ncbi:uncharacterized protein LOC143301152 [Babylonia areolata]|uniref:uncharacterized protein LOC143301152 n=1 Tax=Babylonia areolata TaxID=304850 RepID=UPI003FD443FF